MIRTKAFNFIHVMKTSGTWMLRTIQQVPDGFFVSNRNHNAYSTLTRSEAEIPTFAVIRNPWDWYVSMYFYMQDVVEVGRHDFALPYNRLDAERRKVVDLYKQPFATVMTEGWSLPAMRKLGDHAHELTHREDGLHNSIKWLRFESGGAANFRKMMTLTQSPIPSGLDQRLQERPPLNKSHHAHYSTYYTPDLISQVAARESQIIHKFHYTFDVPSNN